MPNWQPVIMFAKNVIGAVMKYETLIMIVLMKIILALKKKRYTPSLGLLRFTTFDYYKVRTYT